MRSGSLDRGLTRRRRLWQAAAVLAVVVAVLIVFAWQQGGDGGGGGPLNAIAEAAVKTQKEPGERVAMRAVISSGASSFTMIGRGVATDDGQSQMVMRVPNPPEGGPFEMDAIADGTFIYMRSSKFGTLPDGSKWMGLDLALGDEVDTKLSGNVDAKGKLELLEMVGGEIEKLGKKEVRDVSTTHYRGTVSVSELVATLRREGAEELASLTEKEGSPVRVEAWIDGEGLIRRMRIVTRQPSEDGTEEVVDMRMDFFDFGIEPEIEVPDSDEVFDATSQARENAGLSSDG